MIDQLQLIKPKKVKDTLNGILLPHHIVLEFGITKVIIPCETNYQPCVINQKDLYAFEFDSATQIKKYNLPKLNHDWNECVINASDSTVFSAFSASGDDEFFIGRITINNKLSVSLYGFTYAAQYEAVKMRAAGSYTWDVDYHMFYYLFQMFKTLSGKKTDKLLFAFDEDSMSMIYTNEEKSFYIIAGSDNAMRWKIRSFPLLEAFYSKATSGKKQVFKKNIEAESTAKHLVRPLDEVVDISENDTFTKMEGNGYTLCLNKKSK